MRTVRCQVCGEKVDGVFAYAKNRVLVGWHKKSPFIKVELDGKNDGNSCEGSYKLPLELSSDLARSFLGDLKGRMDFLQHDSEHRNSFQETIDHLESVLRTKTQPSSFLLAYAGRKPDLTKSKRPDITKEEGWHPQDSIIDPGLMCVAESYVAREPTRTPAFLRHRFNLGRHASQDWWFSVEDFNDYAYPRFTEFTNGLAR